EPRIVWRRSDKVQQCDLDLVPVKVCRECLPVGCSAPQIKNAALALAVYDSLDSRLQCIKAASAKLVVRRVRPCAKHLWLWIRLTAMCVDATIMVHRYTRMRQRERRRSLAQ